MLKFILQQNSCFEVLPLIDYIANNKCAKEKVGDEDVPKRYDESFVTKTWLANQPEPYGNPFSPHKM